MAVVAGATQSNLHGCRVGKRLAKFSLDGILRRQVELLKELWGHGDALGRAEPVERFHVVVVHVLLAVEGLVGHVVVALRHVGQRNQILFKFQQQ